MPPSSSGSVANQPATLLDRVREASQTRAGDKRLDLRGDFLTALDSLLEGRSLKEALSSYFQLIGQCPEKSASKGSRLANKADLLLQFSRDIVAIDSLLSRQVNAILHHPRFQQLEASWRGLRHLVDGPIEEQVIQVKLLNVSRSE